MSGYNARRAPNVSQYIANLNTVSPADDLATQDSFNLDDDLALFTNPDFFDFDLSGIADLPDPIQYDPAQEERARRQNASAAFRHSSKPFDLNPQNKPTEYAPAADFQFPDYTGVQSAVPDQTAQASPISSLQAPGALPQQGQLQHPQPHGLQHQQQHQQQPQQHHTYPIPSYPPVAPQTPVAAGKRKLDTHAIPAHPDPASAVVIEEASRLAAEEDKRRRNTAASARFRVKKKQREQALERTAKEMTEKVQVLEERVRQLETENKWLKNLITEKNNKDSDPVEGLRKSVSDPKGERSTDEHTTGVGTSAGKKEE